MMSGNNSDNDEFFDAIEVSSQEVEALNITTGTTNTRYRRRSLKLLNSDYLVEEKFKCRKAVDSSDSCRTTDNKNCRKAQNWVRFKELRQRIQTEEEDGIVSNTSPVDSQVSSVEDVFTSPSSKMWYPFRVIEHDTLSLQSISSLGRVGRILSGNSESTAAERADLQITVSDSLLLDEKNISRRNEISASEPKIKSDAVMFVPVAELASLQEPDVIASTKSSNHAIPSQDSKDPQSFMIPPVAPPRRKKKRKIQQTSSLNAGDPSTTPLRQNGSFSFGFQTTLDDLAKELEHSLEMKYIFRDKFNTINAQDVEKMRSENGNEIAKPGTFPGRKCGNAKVTGEKYNTSSPSNVNSCNSSLARNSSTYPLSSVSCNSVGGIRAGLGLRFGVSPHRNKERRRSTGDEKQLPHQLNMFVRTRTDSGKQLSDLEILEQVTVLNLDTGERVPLSIAEDKLPQCINPLSLHIMRLTSEYVSNSNLEKSKESDEESTCSKKSFVTSVDDDRDSVTVIKKAAKLKRLLGLTVRKTMSKAKNIAQEVSHVRHKEDLEMRDDVNPQNEPFKFRASNSHKGPYEFQSLQQVQDLSGEHVGPVWCMKFSCCGRLLATAGQDRILRIWVLKNAYSYFQDMRVKYNTEKVSPTPSQESLVSHQSSEEPSYTSGESFCINEDNTPFMPKPFCMYTGHTSDLLDVSWSKNYFVLSSSMDKTVRLWHISRKECLCCFQHIDFVTAICFHPKDDRYFLSGSLDGRLRLWNIPDKKVSLSNEVDGSTKLITAANFCQRGEFAVVGSYDGRCIFYKTDQLAYYTQIHVRSTRGKNSHGRKISGIEPMPGEDKILVTSNDSRIRLYDLTDLNLSCKYKGYVNVSSQIKASFSHDGKFIICGSENQSIYVWKTYHDYASFPSVRRDRNDFWEGIKAHSAVVTCAIFAPNPSAIIQQLEEKQKEIDAQIEDPVLPLHTHGIQGYVFVSADFSGCIRVFLSKMKPKHSSLPASALV